MSDFSTIQYTCQDGIAHIIFNRPERLNALDKTMLHEINDAIDHAIESKGSPDKRAFMDIARERGMRAAIAWRDARFAEAQSK